jgi:TRAP-type C4-dicarboxylate transport system substrate-binding protein
MRAPFLASALWAAAFVALPAAAQAPGKVFTLSYSPNAQGSAGSAYTTYTHKPFAEILAKDTDGRLRLNVLEQLVPGPKVMDAVLDGTIDMGTQIVGFRAEMALLNFVALPIIPLGKVPDLLVDMRPILRRQVDEIHGAVLLGYGFWGQQRLITKQPVRVMADFNGYKIRVNSSEVLMMFKAAGANPVFIPMAEAYPALQRGVVDGANSSLEGIYGNKFHEVVKHVSNWPIGLTSWIWVANKKSWSALPKDLRNKVIKLFEDKYEVAAYRGGLADDARQKKILDAQGVRFYDPAPAETAQFLKAAPDVMADWKKRAGPHAEEVIAVINKHLGTRY